MKNTFKKALPFLLAATIGLVAMGSAQAAPAIVANAGQVPVARANPGVSQAVIDSLPAAVQASDVHIDSSYKPGMPIYRTDGTLVAGQGAAAMAAAAMCDQQAWGPPFTGTWGPASVCSGVVWGSPGWHQGYSWSTAIGVFTTGCVQARGYNSLQSPTWYGVQCGTGGGGQVPWGNVLANPAARAKSNGGLAGFTVNWQS
jgi:hypothetical protein